MAILTSDSSSQFAALVNQLQNAPDDPALKQALVRRLPEMMALARVNPLAMYRLAQVYAPGSAQYRDLMLKSANNGCTNAMLAVVELLVNTGSAADLRQAVDYMRRIENSEDSYILSRSEALLHNTPSLAEAMKVESQVQEPYSVTNKIRFFPTLARHEPEEEWLPLQSCPLTTNVGWR